RSSNGDAPRPRTRASDGRSGHCPRKGSVVLSAVRSAPDGRDAPGSRAERRVPMPLYMDIHKLDGPVSADEVAHAHEADLAIQADHGVEYKRYWVDEAAGRIFCLVEAPDAETAALVHR